MLCDRWRKIESNGWILKRYQCLACEATIFLSKLYCMLCWNLKCQYGALHRALLKTIFYCLNYSSDLILAVPTFTETGLESRTKGPSHLRNEAGILSRPAAPLSFTFLMADTSSPIWNGAQLSSSTDGALRRFLNCWLRSWSARDLLSLLTISCYFFFPSMGCWSRKKNVIETRYI